LKLGIADCKARPLVGWNYPRRVQKMQDADLPWII
jgi:hypothetical protein